MKSSLALGLFVGVIGCGPGSSDGCGYPPAQSATQPCCESYGIDACAGGLFCAALDGRTIASCFAEYSRPDGTSCTADVQCVSMSCNTTVGACRASGSDCDPEIGCAPLAGNRRACTGSGPYACSAVGDATGGAACEHDSDCGADLHCDAAHRCAYESNIGARCEWDDSDPNGSYTAGCFDSYRTGRCFGLGGDTTIMGYCIAIDPSEDCPEGYMDRPTVDGERRCVATCATGGDCPVPEAGCENGYCRMCNSHDDCRVGLSCVATFNGNLCM